MSSLGSCWTITNGQFIQWGHFVTDQCPWSRADRCPSSQDITSNNVFFAKDQIIRLLRRFNSMRKGWDLLWLHWGCLKNDVTKEAVKFPETVIDVCGNCWNLVFGWLRNVILYVNTNYSLVNDIKEPNYNVECVLYRVHKLHGNMYTLIWIEKRRLAHEMILYCFWKLLSI